MTAYEKGKMLQSTIYQLYSNEGRSISYISKLLKIDRHTLSILINEWNYQQIGQDKRKMTEFLAQHKEKIIAELKNGALKKDIAKKYSVGTAFLNKVFEYDEDIKKAAQFRTFRNKNSIEDIPDERWAPVLGYEKYYISDHGRVKTDIGFITTEINSRSGYIYVGLHVNGKTKNFKVHRLVARAFCDGYSDQKNQVNHKDGNIQNNIYSNLEWVSASENVRHSYDQLNRVHTVSRKLQFEIIYDDKYTFKTIAAFARFLNKSQTEAARWVYECPEKHNIKLKNLK